MHTMSPQYLNGGDSATQRVGNKPWLLKTALKRNRIKGKEDWECSSATQGLANMHEGLIQLAFFLLLPLPSPLFFSLPPPPYTITGVDRQMYLECSGKTSRRRCPLGKVEYR